MTDIIETNTYPARRYVMATDGACRGNPGPGGWGAFLTSFDEGRLPRTKTLSGAKRHTTNNEMELTAAIEALAWLPANDVPALVQSDSRYVINGMNEWRHSWVAKSWRKPDGKPVKNRELWEALIAAMGDREVIWEWVQGHAGHQGNETADQLANKAIDRMLRGNRDRQHHQHLRRQRPSEQSGGSPCGRSQQETAWNILKKSSTEGRANSRRSRKGTGSP